MVSFLLCCYDNESDERYKNIIPLGEAVLSLHRRREPRFYANIIAHNTFWYKKCEQYQ